MKSFREIVKENEDTQLIKAITSIMKSKHYAKNAAIFEGTIYFEFKDVQGSIRLHKKISDYMFYANTAKASSAGEVGFYDSYIAAILDNKDAVAYMKIEFNGDIPGEYQNMTKAVIVKQADYQRRLKEING
jgi:hypothetical protein